MNKETVSRWYGRKLIVNAKVQYVFIYYAISMGIIFFTMGAMLTALAHRYVIVEKYGWDMFGTADYLLAGCLILIIFLGVYVGFVISNNVAGPIFRLLREMTKLADGGKVEKIKFRKNDHFKDLAEVFNRIVDRFGAGSGSGGGSSGGGGGSGEAPTTFGRELKR